MTNQNQRPLNEEFIEQVTQHGVTMYDHYGTPVHHTTDLAVVADYLLSTGERHNGFGLSGMRPTVG
jgi:hypothetical protein